MVINDDNDCTAACNQKNAIHIPVDILRTSQTRNLPYSGTAHTSFFIEGSKVCRDIICLLGPHINLAQGKNDKRFQGRENKKLTR